MHAGGKERLGAKRILASPRIYTWFENALGAHRAREIFVREYLQAAEGERLLDLGCGPADVLDHLPGVDYTGWDANPAYIEVARRRYAGRGNFVTGDVSQLDVPPGSFDVVSAIFVLHHLTDVQCSRMLAAAARSLRPGGRLVTIDPCYAQGQSPIARWIISHDRGAFVREEKGYRGLVERHFGRVRSQVRGDLLRIPYTHCLMTCTEPLDS